MTKRFWNTAVLPVAAALMASPISAAEINLAGTFEFVSASVHYLDTGEDIPDIFGKTAKGYIMYGSDGRMLSLITYSTVSYTHLTLPTILRV